MKLTDLEPAWVNYSGSHSHRLFSDMHSQVDYGAGELNDSPEASEDKEHADGIMFLCPTCFKKNGGPVGTESVLCWFAGSKAPADELPGPGRWKASGTGFNDLSLMPSVNVNHEHWHGFITNGEVT